MEWSNHQKLVEQCHLRGWKACCEPVEVGCRGFADRSLCKVFTLLSMTGSAKGKAIKSTMKGAEKVPDGFGSGRAIHGPMLLGHMPGSDQLWLVHKHSISFFSRSNDLQWDRN